MLLWTEEDKGKVESNWEKNKREKEKWKARITAVREDSGKKYLTSKLSLLVSYELGNKTFPVNYNCQITNKIICYSVNVE